MSPLERHSRQSTRWLKESIRIVWRIEKTKRVLDPSMTAQDQVLVLIYSSNGWVPEQELRGWVEYSIKTHFRTRVLDVLHTDRSLEFDREKKRVRLTPKGAKIVEDRLLVKYRP